MSVEPVRQRMVRLVKVGGSLFELPDLAARLQTWLDAQPTAVNLLLAGGGELADVIRRADQRHRLGEAQCHWMCVYVLGLTAAWLASLKRKWKLIHCVASIKKFANQSVDGAVGVIDPQEFLAMYERHIPGDRLPHRWEATSDSIAARLAVAIDADELVLLKSCPIPTGETLVKLAEAGVVDNFFPRAAAAITRVRIENLRCQNVHSPAD